MRGKYRELPLTTPTRVLIGAEDRIVRAESPQSRDGVDIVEVPGASHFLVDDRPDAVVQHALRPDAGARALDAALRVTTRRGSVGGTSHLLVALPRTR